MTSSYVTCPSGYICQNGACLATSTTTTTIQLKDYVGCSDSDNGKNYYEDGVVWIYGHSKEGHFDYWYYDYCHGNILTEYFCKNSSTQGEEKIDCSYLGNYICKDRKCVSITTTIPNSCSGRCGTYNPKAPCQCDAGCKSFGDCCSDICITCPKMSWCITTTIPNSCSGRCGKYQRGAPCQCDAYCKQYNDCCNDICRTCSNIPWC
jgi:hypothetical protein